MRVPHPPGSRPCVGPRVRSEVLSCPLCVPGVSSLLCPVATVPAAVFSLCHPVWDCLPDSWPLAFVPVASRSPVNVSQRVSRCSLWSWAQSPGADATNPWSATSVVDQPGTGGPGGFQKHRLSLCAAVQIPWGPCGPDLAEG